jgi:mannose-6-phosphate isomerase-like protein (cupin superfamily)
MHAPARHIHLRQDETFRVISGKLGVFINEKEHLLTAEDGEITIPHGARHRFFSHPSATEDLKVKITLNPEDLEKRLDENFLRNFWGYMGDCETHKIQPSPFQMCVCSD